MPDRLSEERKSEIYRAVLDLVGELGFDRVTMEQVAKASHSSTATLYRRWQSKSKLVAEALVALNPQLPDKALVDSGSFATDLHNTVANLLGDSAQASQFFIALQFVATHDPDLKEAFEKTLGVQLAPFMKSLVEAAIERGEFPADHPGLVYLPMLLTAPALVHQKTKDESWDKCGGMHGYIDAVVLPSLGLQPLNFSAKNFSAK